MKKVTVVIPIYNVEKYLKKCLESVVLQSYKNLEIIMINDGSTDCSQEICEEYKNKYENIMLVNKKNEGVSVARNTGINLSTGEYIIFIDADDVLHKHYIEHLVYLLETEDVELAICEYTTETLRDDINREYKKNIIEKNEVIRDILSNVNYGGYLWNKIFIKSIIIEKNIKFQEGITIWEDLLFVIEYLTNINYCVWINSVLYYYRQRNNSAVANMNLKKTQDKLYIGEKIIEYDFNDEMCCRYAKERYSSILFEYGLRKSKQKCLSKKERKNIILKLRLLKFYRNLNNIEKLKYVLFRFSLL